MADLVTWIFFGGLIGWISNIDTDSTNPHSLRLHILLGIFGALLGGFVSNLIYMPEEGGFHSGPFIAAVFTAVAIIGIFRSLRRI